MNATLPVGESTVPCSSVHSLMTCLVRLHHHPHFPWRISKAHQLTCMLSNHVGDVLAWSLRRMTWWTVFAPWSTCWRRLYRVPDPASHAFCRLRLQRGLACHRHAEFSGVASRCPGRPATTATSLHNWAVASTCRSASPSVFSAPSAGTVLIGVVLLAGRLRCWGRE